jgi:hypothetical protein
MSHAITITDTSSTSVSQPGLVWTLACPHERITVRELIALRVRQEVETYNRDHTGLFVGLVRPTQAEQTLNGFKLTPERLLDWQGQIDSALDAFEANGFVILVNERQVESLNDAIDLADQPTVTFLKLVQLVGG